MPLLLLDPEIVNPLNTAPEPSWFSKYTVAEFVLLIIVFNGPSVEMTTTSLPL